MRIRCTVRFDGWIMIGPSYPKAAPLSIITEIWKGKASRMHGTLMGFAPLAASAGSATAAAAAPAIVALPATMPGRASPGPFCEYFVAQFGGDFCMKMLFQSLPGTPSCDVL